MNIAVNCRYQVDFWLKAKSCLIWHKSYRGLVYHWLFEYIYYIEVIKRVQKE